MNLSLKNILTDHVKANQISAVIRFGVALLISVMLVRSHLTDTEVGALEYGILISYSFSFYWAFAYTSGILSRMSKFTPSEQKLHLKAVFLQLIILATILACFSFCTLFILQHYDFLVVDEISNWKLSLYCFLLIVGIIPEVYFLFYKRAKFIIYYSLIYNVLLLFLIVLSWKLHWTITGIFTVYIIIQLARLLLGLYLVKPSLVWNNKVQKSWFFFILPLVVHFILGSSMDYIDGHLVAQFFEEDQFLFYRYGARELPFSLLFINAISAAMIPVLAENIDEIRNLKNRITRLMHFLFPISILFLFISNFLFQFIYGSQFEMSARIFNIYILILSSRILMPQLVLYARNDNKALMMFSGIELMINIILSVIFMQFWGILGIAFATVVAFGFNKILSIIYCKSKYSIPLTGYIDIGLYGFYMLCLLIAFFISMTL